MVLKGTFSCGFLFYKIENNLLLDGHNSDIHQVEYGDPQEGQFQLLGVWLDYKVTFTINCLIKLRSSVNS